MISESSREKDIDIKTENMKIVTETSHVMWIGITHVSCIRGSDYSISVYIFILWITWFCIRLRIILLSCFNNAFVNVTIQFAQFSAGLQPCKLTPRNYTTWVCSISADDAYIICKC